MSSMASSSENTELAELYRRAAEHHQHGRLLEALAVYDELLAFQPDQAEIHFNRSLALGELNRPHEALTSIERTIALKPDYLAAWRYRCVVLERLCRYAEALQGYERIITLAPNDAYAYCRRGYVLEALGRLAEALQCYERAIALKPDYVLAHCARGSVLLKRGDYVQAFKSFEAAIALQPDHAEAQRNRGDALGLLGQYAEALASYERAIALKPDYAEAHNNRALMLERLGRYDEALQGYSRAIALAPGYASALLNHGHLLKRLGRPKEALASYERAITLDPRDALARQGKAEVLLLFGNYASGLELYEERWRSIIPARNIRNFKQPQWRGEVLAEQTLLLHAEQGFGDCMQMLRYLPLVKARAARVILELPRELQPLLGASADCITVVDFASPLPGFDLHCPLMSLPLAFATRVDTVPAQMPYLAAPRERLPKWRSRLPPSPAPLPTLRVGLAWSGRSTYRYDAYRSMALAHLAPLFAVPGITFVSLQRDYRERDLATLAQVPLERIDDVIDDFGDTAAAIEQCDLVISSDTAVAHLAGALGKPLWVLLCFAADWRWLLERDDSPWYPSARLFRQRRLGDWAELIAEVLAALANLHAGDIEQAEE